MMTDGESYHFVTRQGRFFMQSKDRDGIILYKKTEPSLGYTLFIRPLYLVRDIPAIHQWMITGGGRQHDQMPQTEAALYTYYDNFINAGEGYPLMCFVNEKAVAVANCYYITSRNARHYYEYDEEDMEICILMDEHNTSTIHLKEKVLDCCISFLSAVGVTNTIMVVCGEDDDDRSVLQKSGFSLLAEITADGKTQRLYRCSRSFSESG